MQGRRSSSPLPIFCCAKTFSAVKFCQKFLLKGVTFVLQKIVVRPPFVFLIALSKATPTMLSVGKFIGLIAMAVHGVTAIPSQIHLSLGGEPLEGTTSPSGMYVGFYDDSIKDGIVVKYGKTSELLNQVTSTSTNYLKDHGYHHSALIQNLPCDADTIYYEIEGDSAVRSFHRAPCVSPSSFTVSIFGDFGYLGECDGAGV